ncbi:hypothetical protein PYCCODRAFT_905305 [Trametes coccinea BRFM310]|uniref:Uncharacterized protein n=1 Tax=Trametes coccinea (strain BRFM310) TaxID=1353009 RepID=A0A1Y2ICK7_TRAC3|nr:hypothetical protein PYCCODRAFT_905305 [Trametes coccinea BRFM310]
MEICTGCLDTQGIGGQTTAGDGPMTSSSVLHPMVLVSIIALSDGCWIIGHRFRRAVKRIYHRFLRDGATPAAVNGECPRCGTKNFGIQCLVQRLIEKKDCQDKSRYLHTAVSIPNS